MPIGHACADRIQINIGHRRQDGSFIAEQLAFVAAFPEPPLAAILGVRASGDGFGQTAHQPRQIAQAPTQLRQVGRVAENAKSLVLAGVWRPLSANTDLALDDRPESVFKGSV